MIKLYSNNAHVDMADRYIGDRNVSKVYQGDNLIWEKSSGEAYYYVFHSSTGVIDKVPLSDTRYFDEMVTPDTWYGGVAKEYVGKGTYATQIQNGDFSGIEFDEDGHLQDINVTTYDGREYGTNQRFVRNQMYTSRVTPEKNTLYFIVEVYKEFCVQSFLYGYDTTTRMINEYVALFATDSTIYRNYYCIINGDKVSGINAANSVNTRTMGVLTVADINYGKAPRGYVGGLWSAVTSQNVLVANTYYEIIPTITTYDNIIVYGIPLYLYTADMTADNIILSKTPFYYYIYHTADNTIERKSLTANPTVNFPAIAGNRYGGTFTDYGGKGTVATALLNGEVAQFTDDVAQDDGTAYVGENNTATALFDYNNALTEGTTAYPAEVGKIYYVKENPEWAFRNYFYPTYNSASPYPMVGARLLTGVDSAAYNGVTYYFKEQNQDSWTSFATNTNKSVSISGVSLTAYKVFRTNGCPTSNTGYISYVNNNLLSNLEAGKNYLIYVEATTMDNITIHSPTMRMIAVKTLNRGGIASEDIPFEDAVVETADA